MKNHILRSLHCHRICVRKSACVFGVQLFCLAHNENGDYNNNIVYNFNYINTNNIILYHGNVITWDLRKYVLFVLFSGTPQGM